MSVTNAQDSLVDRSNLFGLITHMNRDTKRL